ncbi:hypothetical protein ACIRPT_39980 [Streptomyces sp. NPDC101227]|uniref:hypothetical protein n=1 Tax=Streptomyces sp. NPDC101227 TaxID=3366136 RepID=UPI003812175B
MSAAARWKFGARVIGAIVAAVAIVGAGLWLRSTWIAGASPRAGQLLQADADAGVDPWDAARDVITAYRPTAPYSGETTVRVRRAKSGGWLVTTSYRLVLRPTDKVVSQLRRAPSDIGYVIPNLPGGYATAHPHDGETPHLPKSCVITQQSRNANVTITATHTWGQNARQPLPLRYELAKGLEGARAGAHAHWKFSIDAPDWKLRVAGRPDRQTSHTVTADLARSDSVTRIEAEPPPGPRTRIAPSSFTGLTVVLSTLSIVAVSGGFLLHRVVSSAVPGSTRRRWSATVIGAVAAVALGTCAVVIIAFFHARTSNSPWYGAEYYVFDGPVTVSGQILMQQVLLACSWFTLPVIVLAVCVRLSTRRPPGLRTLAMAAMAAPVLLAIEVVVAGPSRWALTVCLAIVTLTAGAWALLRSRLLGQTGRRWAAAGTAVVLSYLSGLSALSLLPGPGHHMPTADTTWGGAAWPAVVTVLVPWIIVFTRAVLRLATSKPPGLSLLTAAALVCLVLPWNAGVSGGYPRSVELLGTLTDLVPGSGGVSWVGALYFPWQIAWLCAVVGLLAHLRSGGRVPGAWPSDARIAFAALIWLVAAAHVVGVKGSRLSQWPTAAAVILACVGTLWLFPGDEMDSGRRLHRLSGPAHARLMRSLVRAQLLATSRQRFLRESHAALADGSLTADEWDSRWRALGGDSSSGPAGASLRTRSTALGTSAGIPAWDNGGVGATASMLLSLPWTISQVWTSPYYVGIPQAVTAVGGATGLWVFFGFGYGYLYPWLRGVEPIGKALNMFVVQWLLQLLLLLAGMDGDFTQMAVPILLVSVQSLLVALGLGLYWEFRLVRTAGVPWGDIRNFRRLSSLAVPTTTVLVAVITAVATALAGAWGTALAQPSETPPAAVKSTSP